MCRIMPTCIAPHKTSLDVDDHWIEVITIYFTSFVASESTTDGGGTHYYENLHPCSTWPIILCLSIIQTLIGESQPSIHLFNLLIQKAA